MGMPQISRAWTPDEVRTLPDDGRRYEVVAGELLVTPAPSFQHQEAVFRLVVALRGYAERTGVGLRAAGPTSAACCSRSRSCPPRVPGPTAP